MANTKFRIDVEPNPYLAYTTQFACFRSDSETKPFIMQEEAGVQVSALAEGSEEAFKNKRHLYGVSATRNVGYGFWQHGAHATFS